MNYRCIFLVLYLFCPFLAAVAEDLPTTEVAQRLMKDLIDRKLKRDKAPPEVRKAAEKFKVRAVSLCVPAAHQPKGAFVCLVDATGQDEEYHQQTVVFRQTHGKWSVDAPDEETEPQAACPTQAEAEPQLRTLRHQSDLKIKNVLDDGVGDFTTDRGISRDKQGPMRLMCKYEVEYKPGDDELLIIAYVNYSAGKYSIDSDLELWD